MIRRAPAIAPAASGNSERPAQGAPSRRLVDCAAGDRVLVGAVEAAPARIDRLAALGILPGVELKVQQTRPVVVIECDETVLALERAIASEILVVAAPVAAAAE